MFAESSPAAEKKVPTKEDAFRESLYTLIEHASFWRKVLQAEGQRERVPGES